jgi:hypothetical protein
MWLESVKKIRASYPKNPIVIIDDNSDYTFVTTMLPVDNCTVIQSEFPKRGELLPYYYLHKHRWFEKAVILHDSVFIDICIAGFECENIPLWHFDWYLEHNYAKEREMLVSLSNNEKLLEIHASKQFTGMFGVMSVTTLEFIDKIQEKYNFSILLDSVTDRDHRCCLERVMAVIFTAENPTRLKSIFGSIHQYCRWGITFQEYMSRKIQRPVTKVWTGR